MGNTSTYVEKIHTAKGALGFQQKHLHIRGENLRQLSNRHPRRETPPHTWRKSENNSMIMRTPRNTSTYVEKMILTHHTGLTKQKHLHIRGENRARCLSLLESQETPPHTWRKFGKDWGSKTTARNTSTYVEKI